MGYTHKDLVEIGRNWLAARSPITITEISSAAGEYPDVISFETRLKKSGVNMGFGSVLIECKISRSDFLADGKKYYRRSASSGMGDYRYYLAPVGLINAEEIPDKWGLLVVLETGKIKIERVAERQESDKRKEISLLISTLRRLKIDDGNHVSLKKYTYETKNNASLTVNGFDEIARQDAAP
jgi:hypothetical protein